ncbi:hypothetical protein ABPG75_010317 [Micractinium tetrahymenae]
MKLTAVGLLALAVLASAASARELHEQERPSRLVEEVARHLHERGLKIFGGGAATAGRYPYYVSIRDFDTRRDGWQYVDSNFPMQLNSNNPRHLCGGVMVQPMPAPYASSWAGLGALHEAEARPSWRDSGPRGRPYPSVL